MLFVLRYLDRLILENQRELAYRLAGVLNDTSATMKHFGKFTSKALMDAESVCR
jgi:hypothetical protein